MKTSHDVIVLQEDIDKLQRWAVNNGMRFHPYKYKVLSLDVNEPLFRKVLPLTKDFYSIDNIIVDYSE